MEDRFGPNTAVLARFLAQLARLDVADFDGVVRTWRDALRRTDAWYGAEDAVGDAVARTRRDDVMWRLHDALYASFRGGAWYERPLPGGRHAPVEAAAEYLATTAAVALMVIDALPPQHLATLYAPFAEPIPLHEIVVEAPRADRAVERPTYRADVPRDA